MSPALNERGRRIWAATEARAAGRGGVVGVSRATGISVSTIIRGLREVESGDIAEPGRVRRPGAGRKPTVEKDPRLVPDLQRLVEPTASGDPQSHLLWTNKSVRKLAAKLQSMGHEVSHQLVAETLAVVGYTLQSNRKAIEGTSHPDRDAQFRYINQQVQEFQDRRQPVVSVDTKKKELVGDFRNAGKEWRPAGMPERVRVHDFIQDDKGKAIPYGVYDLTRNDGWVSVGIDHDTATFAARTIHRWWRVMGRPAYPKARSLLITADAGGSNGARVRLWKVELQRLADKIGLSFAVCHLPPGTSKWNKIEHRLFSHITMNWRGRPLTNLATIVNLIASTKTQQGLRIRCELDKGRYPKGTEVTDEQLARVRLAPHAFHGDWNYTIKPTRLH